MPARHGPLVDCATSPQAGKGRSTPANRTAASAVAAGLATDLVASGRSCDLETSGGQAARDGLIGSNNAFLYDTVPGAAIQTARPC